MSSLTLVGEASRILCVFGASKGPCVCEIFVFLFFFGSYLSTLVFLKVYGVWVWVGGVGWGVITSLCSTSPYSVHFSYVLFLYVLGVWVGVVGGCDAITSLCFTSCISSIYALTFLLIHLLATL